MIRAFWLIAVLGGIPAFPARSADVPLVERRWVETRSAHFNVYSCAPQQDIYALTARLEQFCEAFTVMAGAQAVSSPPIIVIAFPDHESMKTFLPLHQGKPKGLAGFFRRASDENLIVLALPSTNSAFSGMEIIFHEYTHLLFRRNARIWPLWLTEGMAEVYSTFSAEGNVVRIARPIEPFAQFLSRQSLMPLSELFAVDHGSPHYNEAERTGLFYAQSWLLTHYLVSGGGPTVRARFDRFTPLLQAGQPAERAFTNAFGISLTAMDAELGRYLERGNFPPLQWTLPVNLGSGKRMSTRVLTPVEVYFRLGDELVRIERFDDAAALFAQAQKLAPASPLPYEGLGLLAAARKRPEEAVRHLKDALQRGSTSFHAHYLYGREKYRLTAAGEERYSPLPRNQAAEIRRDFEKAISLMPSFAPAHRALGFLLLVQGDDSALAEKHLQHAVQLEPENPSNLFSLAQAQLENRKPAAARKTLEPLLVPGAEPELRKAAEELLKSAR